MTIETMAATVPFEVGKSYRTQAGATVTCLEVSTLQHYECARFDDPLIEGGGWRYNRASDRGRVTGSAFDMSDPRNVIPELADTQAPTMDAVEAVALAMLNGKRAREGWPPRDQIEPGFIDGDEWRLEAADAIAAARPLIAAEWQPIETAPKDGAILGLLGDSIPDLPFVATLQWWDAATWAELGYGEDDEASDGAWAMWSMHGEDWTLVNPTHWQPLPAPPTAQETIR